MTNDLKPQTWSALDRPDGVAPDGEIAAWHGLAPMPGPQSIPAPTSGDNPITASGLATHTGWSK